MVGRVVLGLTVLFFCFWILEPSWALPVSALILFRLYLGDLMRVGYWLDKEF